MIGFVCDGDVIIIDVEKRKINVDLMDEEFVEWKLVWRVFFYKVFCGILYKYIKNVKLVFEGCVMDE